MTCVSVSVCVYVSVSALTCALIMSTGRNSKKLYISAVYVVMLEKQAHVNELEEAPMLEY